MAPCAWLAWADDSDLEARRVDVKRQLDLYSKYKMVYLGGPENDKAKEAKL